MAKKKETGVEMKFGVVPPKETCEDKNCPFHGSLSIRGKKFVGTVIAAKRHKSVTVSWDRRSFVKKYDRYEKKRTTIHVHNTPCINAKKGDKVRIAECRPLSKTKTFVIIEKIGEDAVYQQRIEGLEESKFQKKDSSKNVEETKASKETIKTDEEE